MSLFYPRYPLLSRALVKQFACYGKRLICVFEFACMYVTVMKFIVLFFIFDHLLLLMFMVSVYNSVINFKH